MTSFAIQEFKKAPRGRIARDFNGFLDRALDSEHRTAAQFHSDIASLKDEHRLVQAITLLVHAPLIAVGSVLFFAEKGAVLAAKRMNDIFNGSAIKQAYAEETAHARRITESEKHPDMHAKPYTALHPEEQAQRVTDKVLFAISNMPHCMMSIERQLRETPYQQRVKDTAACLAGLAQGRMNYAYSLLNLVNNTHQALTQEAIHAKELEHMHGIENARTERKNAKALELTQRTAANKVKRGLA